MFTQTDPEKPTTPEQQTSFKSMCDGCPKRCALSAQQGYNVFIPTIAGTPIYSYIDTKGTKHIAKGTKHIADTENYEACKEMAASVADLCDHHHNMRTILYKPLKRKNKNNGFSQSRLARTIEGKMSDMRCDGCLNKCHLSATYENGVIYPTIAGAKIQKYWNTNNKREIVFSHTCTSFQAAQALATKICKLCLKHKENIK